MREAAVRGEERREERWTLNCGDHDGVYPSLKAAKCEATVEIPIKDQPEGWSKSSCRLAC